MKRPAETRCAVQLICALLCLLPAAHAALPTSDANDDEIFVRLSCANMNNCTTDTTDMINWVNGTGTPPYTRDKLKPIVVTFGPGVFSMPGDRDFCSGVQNVSYRGAGRGVTVITGGKNNEAVMPIVTCSNLSFQDMTIRADSVTGSTTGSVTGANWKGTLTISTWSNVDMLGSWTGWYDEGGSHFWYGSRIEVQTANARAQGSGLPGTATAAYYTIGGQGWFYGSELLAVHNAMGGQATEVHGVFAGASDMHIVGSSVRVKATPGASLITSDFGGLTVFSAKLQMYGGIVSVDVDENAVGQKIYGFKSKDGASGQEVYATGSTAFALQTIGGNISHSVTQVPSVLIKSTYLWPADTHPPISFDAGNNFFSHLKSFTGQDIVVDIDCPSTSSQGCQTAGDTPRLMVYSETCGTTYPGEQQGPWFDPTKKECRGI